MNASAYLASSLFCQPREQRRERFAEGAAANVSGFLEGMHLPGVERALAKQQLLVLPAADTKLVCLEGEVWLTRDGDIEDYILGPGKSFLARRGDRAVVHALQPSRVRLTAA